MDKGNNRRRFFFTADLHLEHTAVIKHCRRPFVDLEEMHKVIINNINSSVSRHDNLCILGDFCWKRTLVAKWRQKIRCKNIVMTIGNHDNPATLRKVFSPSNVWDLRTIKVPIDDKTSQEIVLCHYALRTWNKMHYSTWHLYGHSHGSLPDDPHSLSMDVGVDCHNFFPISFEQIKDLMSKKIFKAIDHHEITGTYKKFIYPDYGTPNCHPDYTAHSGQTVIVLRQLTDDKCDRECQEMYEIKASDGWIGHAHAAELR